MAESKVLAEEEWGEHRDTGDWEVRRYILHSQGWQSFTE